MKWEVLTYLISLGTNMMDFRVRNRKWWWYIFFWGFGVILMNEPIIYNTFITCMVLQENIINHNYLERNIMYMD